MNGIRASTTIFLWIIFINSQSLSHLEELACKALPYYSVQHCSTFNTLFHGHDSPAVIHHGAVCNVSCRHEAGLREVRCQHGEWKGLPVNCFPSHDVDQEQNIRVKRSEQDELMALMASMGADTTSVEELFKGRISPPLDQTGPILVCPPAVHEYADSMQVTTQVTWEEPMAVDPNQGQIKPKRYGAGPRFTFAEGTKTILYLARDESGNLGKCELNITVEVIRCKKMNHKMPHGYFSCHPAPDFVYGSKCTYGCYEGYELDGEKEITCQKGGHWSHSQPKCKSVTCPMLEPFTLGTFTCTDNNNYKSMCSYTCKKGYVIKAGSTRVRVCMFNRKWRGEEPICVDRESPRFQSCPGSVSAIVDAGSTSARVTWEVPRVKDNSLENIVPTLKSKIRNHQTIGVGVFDVEYAAVDKAGNMARPCRFKVIVKELKCPVQYALPYMTVTCPTGTGVGSRCSFSCQSGYILNGTKETTCKKSKTVPPYSTWDWSQGRPICNAMEPCPKPEAPVNGALACDLWENGRFCQMQCMKGTDIPPSFTAWKLFVCSDGGKWNFEGNLPACEKTTPSHGTVMSVSMHYYQGRCPDPKVKQQIRKNFIAALHLSPFSESWKKTESRPENVQVFCGKIRQKRSTDSRTKYKIEMKVNIRSNLSSSLDIQSAVDRARTGAHTILSLIQNDVRSNTSRLLPATLVPDAKVEVATNGVELDCPEGLFPSYKTYSCVGCTQGTFYNAYSKSCVVCPSGQYQPMSGRSECIPCPVGTTTTFPGATKVEQCRKEYCSAAICRQGMFSKDGVEPCLPCEQGSYQSEEGAKSCHQCPGGTSTIFQGSTEETACQGYELAFNEGGTAVTAQRLAPHWETNTYTITFWLLMSWIGETDFLRVLTPNSEIRLYVDSDKRVILTINSEAIHSTTRYNVIREDDWNYYHLQVKKNIVLFSVNGHSPVETVLGSAVSQLNGTLTIRLGGTKFEGSVYQVNVWSASKSPKFNDPLKCLSRNTGDILSWTRFSSARMVNSSVKMPTTCDDVDECLTSPCLRGTCTGGVNTYHCSCAEGYTGDNCEIDIDECHNNLCENGAHCVDGLNNFHCVCAVGFKGKLCDQKIVDGQWGTWNRWSDCSASCGKGTKQRERLCDNPVPYNGGKECRGKGAEIAACDNQLCPVCASIVTPAHGVLECHEIGDTHTCNVSCKEGYAFETPPLDIYQCGPSTGHEWNFRSEGPMNTSLPRCLKVERPKEMSVTFRGVYKDLYCTEKSGFIKKLITSRVQRQIGTLPCHNLKLCVAQDVIIHDCKARTKRDTNRTSAAFSVTISNMPGSGVKASLRQLNGALGHLMSAARTGKFTVAVGRNKYRLAGTPGVTAGVTCKEGCTRVDANCIPCAAGTFYKDGICIKCPKGSYQTINLQSDCIQCPAGSSTAGRGATSARNCTVKCPPGHYMLDQECYTCERGEYQPVTGQTSCRQCPAGQDTADQGAVSKKECLKLSKADTGRKVSKHKFVAKRRKWESRQMHSDDEQQMREPPFISNAEIPVNSNAQVSNDSNAEIWISGDKTKIHVGIAVGAAGIGCLTITVLILAVFKIRHSRFNKIKAREIENQLQAIARAVTFITVPITGIPPNHLPLTLDEKKDI